MSTNSTAEIVREFNQGIGALAAEPATSAVLKAFQELHKAASAPGALPSAVKELIALAIAIATQCDGCIAWHVTNAVKAGAQRDQVLETIGVAVMMGGGPATYYGSKAARALDSVAAS
ncbi:carboxymuconolactone decarboxylase family protein [Nocardia sp. R7R-8]|uniref:carboxymuconolactone decarboxylase family protein n=1 Tax=Nocardia sp. R7R-8 TaxID=3459304 RepID=UPI00403DE130